MRKKVIERLRPYLALADSEAELRKLVESLPPSQLGELKDLMGRYHDEFVEKANAALALAKTQHNIDFITSHVDEVKKVNSIFTETFRLRKLKKMSI